MNKLKPIEPGCLALVVRQIIYYDSVNHIPPEPGTILKIEVLAPDDGLLPCRHCGKRHFWYWEGSGTLAISECCLLRIDPDEDQNKLFEEEKKTQETYAKYFIDDYISPECR